MKLWPVLRLPAILICCAVGLLYSATGVAQESATTASVEDFGDLLPRLGGELHISSAIPMGDGGLCPAEAGCVWGQGFGIGASFERRLLWGIALALGYDLWLIDTDSVYELGVVQFFYGALRYYLLPEHAVHPFIGVGIGAQVLGDTFRVATIGPSAQLMLGAEWELDSTVGFTAAVGLRASRMSAFTTPRDDVLREPDGRINTTLTLQIGVSVLVL